MDDGSRCEAKSEFVRLLIIASNICRLAIDTGLCGDWEG